MIKNKRLKTIDTIGELDMQIGKLQVKRDRLAKHVKSFGVGKYDGGAYQGSVFEREQRVINLPKLKRKLGAEFAKFVQTQTLTCLRVTRIGGKVKRRVLRDTEAA
jgi:hypothetical protein